MSIVKFLARMQSLSLSRRRVLAERGLQAALIVEAADEDEPWLGRNPHHRRRQNDSVGQPAVRRLKNVHDLDLRGSLKMFAAECTKVRQRVERTRRISRDINCENDRSHLLRAPRLTACARDS